MRFRVRWLLVGALAMSSLSTTGCDQEDFGFLLDFLGFGGGSQPGLQTPIPGFQGSGSGTGGSPLSGAGGLTYQNPDGSLLGHGGSTSTIGSNAGFSPGGFPQVGVRGTQQQPLPSPSFGGLQTGGGFQPPSVAQRPNAFPPSFQGQQPFPAPPNTFGSQPFPRQPNTFAQQPFPTQPNTFGQPVQIAPTPQFTGEQPAPQTFVADAPELRAAPGRDGFDNVPTVFDAAPSLEQAAPRDSVPGLGQAPQTETIQPVPDAEQLRPVDPVIPQGIQQTEVPRAASPQPVPEDQSPDQSNQLENFEGSIPQGTGGSLSPFRSNDPADAVVLDDGAALNDVNLDIPRGGGGGSSFRNGLNPDISTFV